MESVWSKEQKLRPRDAFFGEASADVVVIGAGLAGILTAYKLKEQGLDVIVLEKNRIFSGQSGNTTGKITSQHGIIYSRLIDEFGEDAAKQYAAANQRAIKEYEKIIGEKGIECAFKKAPAYLYTNESATLLEAEAKAMEKAGLNPELTTKTELPVSVTYALKLSNQAHFNPMAFAKVLADELNVYEETSVKYAEEDGSVITANGTIHAKYVVFCSHYPFINRPGYYFMRMHQERSYVLALSGAQKLDGMYLGIDKNGLSFRPYKDMLLLGGAGHRPGENRTGGCYNVLRRAAKEMYPDALEEAHWSAQDCKTTDCIAYIGRYSDNRPNWFVATGFGKWGMTTSMVAADIIRDIITERKNDCAEIFSPKRFDLSASVKNIMTDTAVSVKGLMRTAFSVPQTEIDKLPIGHGGVVTCDGEKAGVYKDEDGQVHVVSAKCPHLGCELTWNPDEKSWDCPCHGSRFDYKGHVLDNPAQEDLPHA